MYSTEQLHRIWGRNIHMTAVGILYMIKLLFIQSITSCKVYMTQFEFEGRSCGQSITNFRFFSCGGQNKFTGCHSLFYGSCKKLTDRWKKCPKSIKFWLCIRYCTDRLALGHVQLFNQFLEVKLNTAVSVLQFRSMKCIHLALFN